MPDLDAERCVLGSMMLDESGMVRAAVSNIITRDAFFQEDHRIIFDIISALHRAQRPIDAVIVSGELSSRQLLEECGGSIYLARILNTVPSAAHGEYYAKIVKEKSSRK